MTCLGGASHGRVGPGMVWRGEAGQGLARAPMVRGERYERARQGRAWRGEARHGWAWRGMA